MPTKHVTNKIEAYLDHHLPAEESRRVEEHIARCPACAHRLFEAQRLANELGATMKKKLGLPHPPPDLRQRTRQRLNLEKERPRFHFPWAASGRLLNAVGTLAIVAVLISAAFVVIQSQLLRPDIQPDSRQSSAGADEPETADLAAARPPLIVQPDRAESSSTPGPNLTALGDSLPAASDSSDKETARFEPFVAPDKEASISPLLKTNQPSEPDSLEDAGRQEHAYPVPGGTIAFSFFNSGAQFYEIHLVDSDGTNRRRFPVDGASDPALRPSETGEAQIVYRTWGQPTTPRSLISNNLGGEQPDALTNFWEDAQPDWSPLEKRIIFASQRESDRRWRLYTVWHDGSAEKDLRREGKSPTFAPDGYRFAFVGCEEPATKTDCGLLRSDLDNSEHQADLFLADPLAQAPDWSPVGEKIAYMANPKGNWDLYVINSDGSHKRRLTRDTAIDGLPAWSPDGKWLAFLSNRSGAWGVWLIHAATGQKKQIVTFNKGDVMTPGDRPPYYEYNWWDEQLSWSR